MVLGCFDGMQIMKNNEMHFTDDSKYKSAMIKKSRKLIGYFTYGTDEKREDWGLINHPNKDGHTDCSSFVWLVMKQAGANVGDQAFSTPEMENDAKGVHRFLKQVKARDVKPGDVVIVNVDTGYDADGHTAIIDGPYRGRKTQIIEIGGIKPNSPVHRSQIGASFGRILKQGRITYARVVLPKK